MSSQAESSPEFAHSIEISAADPLKFVAAQVQGLHFSKLAVSFIPTLYFVLGKSEMKKPLQEVKRCCIEQLEAISIQEEFFKIFKIAEHHRVKRGQPVLHKIESSQCCQS